MQPQDILENEEKKRVNALARRKNLIQGLGIVDQLSRLLPTTERSSDTHRACTVTSEIQVTEDNPDHSTRPSQETNICGRMCLI